MGSQQEATDAIAALNGAAVCGTVIVVRWATAQEQKIRPEIESAQ